MLLTHALDTHERELKKCEVRAFEDGGQARRDGQWHRQVQTLYTFGRFFSPWCSPLIGSPSQVLAPICALFARTATRSSAAIDAQLEVAVLRTLNVYVLSYFFIYYTTTVCIDFVQVAVIIY